MERLYNVTEVSQMLGMNKRIMREALDYKAADPFPEGWFCGEVHCGDDRGESPWIQGHRGGLRMEERKTPLGVNSGELVEYNNFMIDLDKYNRIQLYFILCQ